MRELSPLRSGTTSESVVPHLPSRVLSAGLMFCALGFLLHFVPNFGTPLQSDTDWIYRLMTASQSNEELAGAIPRAFQELGAYPQGPISGFVRWYQATGRLNIADSIAWWQTARFAGDSADLWRLVAILFMSLSVSLFYLISVRLGVARTVALLLSLSLMMGPFDIWDVYNTSEPRALFFMMLALYLTLRSANAAAVAASAVAMLLAVLTKEPFVVGWALVPLFIVVRESSGQPWEPGRVLRGRAGELSAHAIAIFVLAAFVIYLRANVSVLQSNISIAGGFPDASFLLLFALYFVRSVVPWVLAPLALLLLLLTYHRRDTWQLAAGMREWQVSARFRWLVSGLGLVTAMSALVYLGTGRLVAGHYAVPSNVFAALLLAVLVSPAFRAVAPSFNGRAGKLIVVAVVLTLVWPLYGDNASLLRSAAILAAGLIPLTIVAILHYATPLRVSRYPVDYGLWIVALVVFIPAIANIVDRSAQYRVDQWKWRALIDDVVTRSPRGATVLLRFADPTMFETAASLQANTLLAGRYDLVYRLAIQDTSLLAESNDLATLTRSRIDAFNESSPGLSDNRPVVTVTADRKGERFTGESAREGIGAAVMRAVRNPLNFFGELLVGNKRAYLNYSIT